MGKFTLKDLSLQNERVLMRVDFNVPMKDGRITDDTRIRAALASIRYVLDKGASLVLMSHLGRPDGKRVEKYSLAPVAKRLSELLGVEVVMARDCETPIDAKVVLLENLRFYAAEEDPKQDPTFAQKLARLGTCYVDDAFGAAHREHASITGVPKYFPGKSAMGFLMEQELNAFEELLKEPKRPFYAIIGGAKISSKIGVIQKLLTLVDRLLIGGAMAYTFFKAKGLSVGDSPVEDPKIIQDLDLSKIRLPVDLLIAKAIDKDAEVRVHDTTQSIPDGWQGVDIGPETMRQWGEALKKPVTVFWNGPVGIFEIPAFAKGTKAIADALCKKKAILVAGGGETLAAIEQTGQSKNFTHLSTGGGASLELLEFSHLPGIDVLSDK